MVKKEKDSEEANTVKTRLGDNLFVLLCSREFNGNRYDKRALMKQWKSLIQEIKIDSKESEFKNICFIWI